jgi:hypothetical protein
VELPPGEMEVGLAEICTVGMDDAGGSVSAPRHPAATIINEAARESFQIFDAERMQLPTKAELCLQRRRMFQAE